MKGKKPKYIIKKLERGAKIYTSPHLQKTFGFNLFEPINDLGAVASYLIKLFSLGSKAHNANERFIYSSHGLNRPLEVARGELNYKDSAALTSICKYSYKLTNPDTGICYGINYIIDNTLENKQLIINMLK